MDGNSHPQYRLPDELRVVQMMDTSTGLKYKLAFSVAKSGYEAWIESLGGPDENVRLLLKLLQGRGTLLDVGANIGTISAPVAASGSAVISVEMLPQNCMRLWAVLALNSFKNMQIIQAGASDRDGILNFAGEEAWGAVTVDPNAAKSVALQLDTIIATKNVIEPLVLKVDVEGHEESVFRGGRETIEKYRPFILFESIVIEGENGAGLASKSQIESYGYQLFVQRHSVLSPCGATDIQFGHVADFLAVPKERVDGLSSLGLKVRNLAEDEQVSWLKEMAEFDQPDHQRHAARTILRLKKEQSNLVDKIRMIIPSLMLKDHLSDLHPALRDVLEA